MRTFSVQTAGQTVTVSGIKAWSVCEHHLMPFEVTAEIVYRVRGTTNPGPDRAPLRAKVLGLSKFAQLVQAKAARLQIQERLTQEVLDALEEVAGREAEYLRVTMVGRHLCAATRGHALEMTTTAEKGRP